MKKSNILKCCILSAYMFSHAYVAIADDVAIDNTIAIEPTSTNVNVDSQTSDNSAAVNNHKDASVKAVADDNSNSSTKTPEDKLSTNQPSEDKILDKASETTKSEDDKASVALDDATNNDVAIVKVFVEKLLSDTFAILNSADDVQVKKDKATKLITDSVDLEYMAKYVLGRERRDMDHKKIEDFSDVYKLFFSKTYAASVDSFKGQKVNVNTVKEQQNGDFIVDVQIIDEQNVDNTTSLLFMLHNVEGKKLVFDIVTEGVSLIRTQQSEFVSIITKDGIDALINSLQEKVK